MFISWDCCWATTSCWATLFLQVFWLVVSITYPSETYESQLGLLFPTEWEKNVPNHQPEKYILYHTQMWTMVLEYSPTNTGQILGYHGPSGKTNSSRYFYWLFMDIYGSYMIYMFMDLHGFISKTWLVVSPPKHIIISQLGLVFRNYIWVNYNN